MIECIQCGSQSKRNHSLIATVVRDTEKRIVIDVTEPQDIPKKAWVKYLSFPFKLFQRFPDDSNKDFDFCSVNCFRLWIRAKLNEKTKRQRKDTDS